MRPHRRRKCDEWGATYAFPQPTGWSDGVSGPGRGIEFYSLHFKRDSMHLVGGKVGVEAWFGQRQQRRGLKNKRDKKL